VVAFVPGADDLLAFFHEPGVLALGAGPVQGRLVKGKITFRIGTAAVKKTPAGPAFCQVPAAAFPGAGVGGGLRFQVLEDHLSLGVPGKILGESTLGIPGAAQEFS